MRELTLEELHSPAGGVAPLVAAGAAALGLYGAGKSIFALGQTLGRLLVENTDPQVVTQ